MANTDIFNPVTGYSPTMGFNPNWNYGSPRKSAANFLLQSPRLGSWYSRLVGNGGYSFDLVFVDRPIEQVRYIKAFYQAFQQGYFTLVDYDDAARHHVGRFTAYADDTETANLKYTIRVTFSEIPRAPMLAYPSNFENDGHSLYVVNDDLIPQPAAMIGTWTPQVSPLVSGTVTTTVAGIEYLSPVANLPSSYELLDATANAGDWAQIQYVGWGFSMTFRLDPGLGYCCVFLDGNPLVLGLDQANGTVSGGLLTDGTPTTGILNGATVTVNGPDAFYPHGSVTVRATTVPLDLHRVKILAGQLGVAGGGGISIGGGITVYAFAGNPVIFPSLEYIF